MKLWESLAFDFLDQLSAAHRTDIQGSGSDTADEEGVFLALDCLDGPDGLPRTLEKGVGAQGTRPLTDPLNQSIHAALVAHRRRVSHGIGMKASDQF